MHISTNDEVPPCLKYEDRKSLTVFLNIIVAVLCVVISPK